MTGAPVDRLEAAAYRIPTDAPEADGTLAWDHTTLVTVTVAAGGREGLGWTYAPPACADLVEQLLAPVVVGRPATDLPAAFAAMQAAVRNTGPHGLATYAVSAVDVALWDLKARLLEVSLVSLLGRAHPDVPVYGSGGFTTYDDARLTGQLEGWLAEGLDQVKIKIGEDAGGREDRDLRRVARTRDVVGPGTGVFVDANGGYTAKQAIRVGHRLDEHAVTWFEEPVSSDDRPGLALVRDSVEADVTAGEYATDPYEIRRLCPVLDCLQLDATRCGGVTGWLRGAAVAASFGRQVSGHCAPQLHAPIAAATANTRHLEWFHDHVRIERRYLDGALSPAGGALRPDPDAPGLGVRLKRADLEVFRTA